MSELHDQGPKGASVVGYIYWRCRCAECRRIWNAYRRVLAARNNQRGLCRRCKRNTAINSTSLCEVHLEQMRERLRPVMRERYRRLHPTCDRRLPFRTKKAKP